MPKTVKPTLSAAVVDGSVVATYTNFVGGWVGFVSPTVQGWVSASAGSDAVRLGNAVPGTWTIHLATSAGKILATTTLVV